LLKALSHPNIVAYKGSLVEKGILIIIMEFCDVGDLSFHIKKRRAKNEFFTETEIMNWFVQLCMALEYIQARKVLHRDIKSSNVFLTRNNTIKLGDFGISKVLENTND
jgi:NIMA (never in mitosis gene a)-related kinase